MKKVVLIAVVLGLITLVLSRQNADLGTDFMWAAMGVQVALLIPLAIRDVRIRRRMGQNWSEALAQGKNTATGSVWYDGAILLGVILATFGLVALILSI